jgi:hypothetical protein
MAMEESTTYQWVLEQGALREARKNLLLVGHARFRGTPPGVRKTIEAIADLAHLEDLLVRSQNAATWQELLGLLEPARRSTRRKPKA